MAKPACSNVNPDGTFIDVRLGDNEYAQEAVKQELDRLDELGKGKPRAGDGSYTKREYAERASRDLARMMPFSPKKMEQYMLDQGWFKRDAAGNLRVAPNLGSTPEMGYVNSILKVYLEGRSQGVKQLANNFLMKVKNGESAIQEGLLLAQQMQSMSRWGAQVVYMDKALGSGLQQSAFARGQSGRFDQVGEALGEAVNADQYEDIFKKIYGDLNGGNITAGMEELLGLAKKISFMENPHEISKQVLGMKIAGGAWNEVWINGLLSAPLTFTTNLFSATYAVARPLLTLGAAKATAMTTGSRVAEQVAAEAAATVAEMYSAFADAMAIGVKAFSTESALYGKEITPAITSNAINSQLKDAGRKMQIQGEWAETLDLVGRAVRLPGRAMLGTDEMAKHMAYRGRVAALGVRNAARDGVDLTNKALVQDYIAKEMGLAFDLTNPDTVLKWKPNEGYNLGSATNDLEFLTGVQGSGRTVSQEAQEATFQEANGVADAVNKVINKYPALKPFVPFVRTPLNIIKGGFIESTPIKAIYEAGGSLKDAAFAPPTQRVLELQRRLLQDPDESFRIAGQIALMTTVGAATWGMVMTGQMTGGGPGKWTVPTGPDGAKNPRALRKAQQAWLAAGNVPYSLKVPGTDTWIPLDRFGEPFSIALRMIADLGMYSGYMSRADQDAGFAAWVGIASSGLFNASFARGIYELMGIARNEDAGYVMSQQARNYVATQLPFGSFLASIDRMQNPYKGAYEETSLNDIFAIHEDAFGKGLFGKLAAKIPGVETSPQLVDQLTGAPVPITPGTGPNGLNPFQQAIPLFPRNSKVDDTWQTTMDILGSYQEKSAPFELTSTEQQQFNQLMATVRINGKTVSQAIRQFRNRADAREFIEKGGNVLSGSRFQVQLDFNNMLNEYKSRALLQLEMQNPNVLERSRLTDAGRQLRRANDLEGAQQLSSQIDSLLQRADRGY